MKLQDLCQTKCGMSCGHTEISRKLLCVKRGTHEDDREVLSGVEKLLHNDEQNVRLQVPLVDLVQHQVADTGQHTEDQKKIRRNGLSLWLILGQVVVCPH